MEAAAETVAGAIRQRGGGGGIEKRGDGVEAA